MTNKEIRNTMKCLELMCKDLNDIHNDYDEPTTTENNMFESLKDAINEFNNSQSTWKCKIVKGFGWWLKYE